MNGSIRPLRALERSAECSAGQEPTELRSSQGSGEVGSHGASHSSLRIRISLHARASRSRGGRSTTGPTDGVAGQPGAFDNAGYRLESSRGITVTYEPATTSVSSSGMTTRQLDSASDAIRCEP